LSGKYFGHNIIQYHKTKVVFQKISGKKKKDWQFQEYTKRLL
jgi:hypothetical protein